MKETRKLRESSHQPAAAKDKWAAWLLDHRFGGNAQVMEATLSVLGKARDRILENAKIGPGHSVLDIGTGDGLLGMKALEMTGEKGHVIFSDISQDCLDYIKRITADSDRVSFLNASATHLAEIVDESVDRVVSRAVLIYIDDKATCFKAFYRVLNKGGILSIAEPISQFSNEFTDAGYFRGYDCSPINELVRKIKKINDRQVNAAADPMTNFNERDLFRIALNAGFKDVWVEFDGSITQNARYASWDAFLKQSPNPTVPALTEAMHQTLSPEERNEFEAYLRPKIENEPARYITATAYLVAEK
jgi:ubiquinone/menaquinone biosynthesis C-methylase UbiE